MCASAMLSLLLSGFWLLGAIAGHSVTGQGYGRYPHDVCFDGEGSLVMSIKQFYPVTQFTNRGTTLQTSTTAYWEVGFRMPAFVYGISITGKTAAYTTGITVKLLGAKRKIKKITYQAKQWNLNTKDVYYIRIEKSGLNLNLEKVKVYGIQTPPNIACSSKVEPILGGCYSIYQEKGVSKIRFKCSRGFEFPSSISSITHRCSQIPEPYPQCQQLDLTCSAPSTLQNSRKTIEHQTYYEKETIQYGCSPGYDLIGPSVLTCERNGSWTPIGNSTCQKTRLCSAPEEPSNGWKRGSNYRHGQSVSFFCYPGYELFGPSVVQCTTSSSWDPLPNVFCKAKECPSFDNDDVANGVIRLRVVGQPGYTYGNFLEIKCNSGFFLTGNNIITCTESGSWDSTLPNCTAKIGICSEKECGKQKECLEERGEAKCVCSASLQHGCLSDSLPICASNNITFWSQCDMLNYSCLNPEERFSIVRFSPCDEGQLRAVKVSTSTGVEKELVYKCSFPKNVGSCRAHFSRFYFDQEQNTCQSFGWGGCNANANNFETLQECESVCSEFRACNRSQRFESALETNLALKRPTTPSSLLAASFVDGSRVFNESWLNSTKFWSWKVALKAPSTVSRIVVWNSDKSIPWLHITVRDENSVISSKYFNHSGGCRYEWTLQLGKPVLYVGLETAQLDALHVDEVEVIGKHNRGMLINLKENNAAARQYPTTFIFNGISASAEKAINGRLENNSAAEGFVNCASTTTNALRHWFQIDLKRAYFITEVELWLREGEFRRKWQTGLTVHVSKTPGNFNKGSSLPISIANRCGVPYSKTHEKHPTFPCYFDYSTRYVIMNLDRNYQYGIQLCEVQVFAATCDSPQRMEHATLRSTKTSFFAPAKVSYKCNSGYKAVTSLQYSCGRTSQWVKKDPEKPLCKRRIPSKSA